MNRSFTERGSMSVLAVGCTAGLVGLLLVLLVFDQVWLGYMRSQMVADAAAWGALEGLRPGMEEELGRRARVNLDSFWSDVSAAASRRVDDWEAWYRDRYEPDPDDYEDEEAYREAVREFLADLREQRARRYRAYREDEVWGRKPEIANLLLDGNPLPLSIQVRHFLTAQERACAIRAAAEHQAREMTAVAHRIAVANGADLASSPVVEVEGSTPGILARIALPLRFLLVERYFKSEHRALEGRALVQIRSVAGAPVHMPDTCP